MQFHDIEKIKAKIHALDTELRRKDFIDYFFKAINNLPPLSFNLKSYSKKIASIPDKPGVYVFYIKFQFPNHNAKWKQQFQIDWMNPDVKNFQHSPAVIKSRLNKKTSPEWVPLYLGRSEHIRRRLFSHINLDASKKTFSLKLMARKDKMDKHKFSVKYYCFDKFGGMQILLQILEKELRKRIEPITGRQ